jgi:hypothetical protein
MKKIFISFLILLAFSCKQNTKEVSKLTNKVESNDNALHVFENRSKLFKAIKENDSLSTYGSEVYRLFLITPFNPFISFRLISNDSTFKLTAKTFYIKQADGQGSDTLISQREINLTEKDAIFLKRQLYSSMLWNLKSDQKRGVLDASYWDIECYNKSGEDSNNLFNHSVLYSRKIGPLRDVFDTLIRVSGLKLEYYK